MIIPTGAEKAFEEIQYPFVKQKQQTNKKTTQVTRTRRQLL